MNLLALDTSLAACAVATVTGGAAPVIRSELVERAHNERLLTMTGEAMAAAGLAFSGLDRIAVAIGPGSFTGLRVGIAAARALALVAGCPVAGIGNLAVHAAAARALAGAVPVLAVTTAGRGDVYGQAFAADGAPLGPPRAAPPETFAGELAPGTVLAGSAADALAALAGAPVVHRMAAPDMAALCRLALDAPVDGAPVRPLYLRPPDAKPQAGAAVARR